MNKVYTLYITGYPDQSFSNIELLKEYVRNLCSSKTKEEVDKLEILFDDKNVINFKEHFGDEKLGISKISYISEIFDNVKGRYVILGEHASLREIIRCAENIKYHDMMFFCVKKYVNDELYDNYNCSGDRLSNIYNYFSK